MTPEERVAYIHEGAQEALRGLPKLNPEDAQRQLHAILYPEEMPTTSQKKKGACFRTSQTGKKVSGPRKVSKRVAHA